MGKMLGNDAQIMFSVLYDPVNRGAYLAWMGVMRKAFPDLGVNATRTFDMGSGWVVSEVTMSWHELRFVPRKRADRQVVLRARGVPGPLRRQWAHDGAAPVL